MPPRRDNARPLRSTLPPGLASGNHPPSGARRGNSSLMGASKFLATETMTGVPNTQNTSAGEGKSRDMPVAFAHVGGGALRLAFQRPSSAEWVMLAY
jgi:hypothetical protein